MRATNCKSCGDLIVFAGTGQGKRMPLDALPNPEGNVRLDESGVAQVIGPLDRMIMSEDEIARLMMPHFATCPNWGKLDDGPSLGEAIGGRTRHDHPETSKKAGRKIRSGTQHAQIAVALLFHPEGLTAYDLSDGRITSHGRSISPNQIATRLLEMRDRGWVEYLSNDRGVRLELPTSPGNTGLVQVLTADGRMQANRFKEAR